MKKTVIFIDGQNLFYTLKNMRLLEKNINWTSFFKNLLEPNDELVRVYWYQPQKLSESRFAPERARNVILRRDEQKRAVVAEIKRFGGQLKEELPLTPKEIEEQTQTLLRESREWHQEQIRRYEKQLHRYDELAIRYPEIEMVRKGIVRIDPFEQDYLGEKGVDVAIAVNMIKLHEKCDKTILISGDLDYAEAIQFIKDNLKIVYIVRLFKGEPPINRNVSRTLMALADKVLDVYESQIRSNFLIANTN